MLTRCWRSPLQHRSTLDVVDDPRREGRHRNTDYDVVAIQHVTVHQLMTTRGRLFQPRSMPQRTNGKCQAVSIKIERGLVKRFQSNNTNRNGFFVPVRQSACNMDSPCSSVLLNRWTIPSRPGRLNFRKRAVVGRVRVVTRGQFTYLHSSGVQNSHSTYLLHPSDPLPHPSGIW